MADLNVPTHDNKKLEAVVEKINNHTQLQTYWQCSNVVAIDRLKYNDHGPIHIKIVTNLALKLFRMLMKSELISSIEENYQFSRDDAEIVVVMGACLHDVGHIVHRTNHEEFSVALAPPLIADMIGDLYDVRELAIMTSEILHAIYAHRTDIQPLTVEAGVIKIADALDMETGRARIPYDKGSASIHAVSAIAIEKVRISEGTEKPICIDIQMSNSAGIYQLDNLLKRKLETSGLSEHFELRAEITGEEKKIVETYKI